MTSETLTRGLGLTSAIALVVSNMVGTGIFSTSGFLAGDLGSPGLVVGIWFVGGALALAGAVCYSELAVNLPHSGGEYIYLREAYGSAWGFIDGWVSFFAGFSAPIAAAALAMVSYLAYFDPAMNPNYEGATRWEALGVSWNFGAGPLIAAVVVLALTALNVVGVAFAGRVQNALTVLKIAVLLALLGLGFTVGAGDWGHLTQAAERTSTNALPAQFALSLIFVYFGYSGWNAAVYVAEEIRDPARTLPRALLIGAAAVILLYAALNILFLYALPVERLQGVIAVGAHAAEALFGPRGGAPFAAAMAASLLASLNAMCLVGPRVYYAMARDGAFFSVAARIHPRFRTPWVAVTAQGVCAALLILTGAFESLLYYIGFTLWLFTAMSVTALFRFRRRADWRRLPAVSFGWPAIPAVYVIANAYVFLYFALERQWEALWSLATIGAGAAAWSLFPRRAGGRNLDTSRDT